MTLGRTLAAFGAALTMAGLASAATYDFRDTELISVSGNSLIVREGSRAADYTVGGGATFTVNGATTSLASLRPGMKITGEGSTATPPVPMSLVELKESTVTYTMGGNLIVTGDQPHELLHFSDASPGGRGVLIYRNGTVIQPASLVGGDRITATVVTKFPPKAMSEDDMTAFVEAEKRKPGTVRSIADMPKINRRDAAAVMSGSQSTSEAPPDSTGAAPPSTPPPASAPPSATAGSPTTGATPRVAAARPSAPPPAHPAPAPATPPPAEPPARTAPPKELPKTGTARPAVALAGLIIAGLGATLTLQRRLRART